MRTIMIIVVLVAFARLRGHPSDMKSRDGCGETRLVLLVREDKCAVHLRLFDDTAGKGADPDAGTVAIIAHGMKSQEEEKEDPRAEQRGREKADAGAVSVNRWQNHTHVSSHRVGRESPLP